MDYDMKIQYDDKENIKVNEDIAAKNKITANDMNEIKKSINNIYDINKEHNKLIQENTTQTQSNTTKLDTTIEEQEKSNRDIEALAVKRNCNRRVYILIR